MGGGTVFYADDGIVVPVTLPLQCDPRCIAYMEDYCSLDNRVIASNCHGVDVYCGLLEHVRSNVSGL